MTTDQTDNTTAQADSFRAQSEESWQQGNAEFLSVALRWVRLLLEELAGPEPRPGEPEPARKKRWLFGRSTPPAPKPARSSR